jgi:hypothetical protein
MLRFTPVRAFVLLSAIAISCEEEKELSQKQITVQFASSTFELTESDEAHEVKILLSQAATTSVLIPVKVSGTTDFTSNPAATNNFINVAVAKGKFEGVFRIKANDNTSDDPDRLLKLEIGALTLPLISGQQLSFSITIKDDDAPAIIQSVANFAQTNLVISENDEAGVDYVIQFSAPAALDSKLTIALGSQKGIYAQHYTASPEPVAGKLELSVPAGAQTASFRINAIPNVQATGELSISIDITEVAGSLVKGTNIAQVLRITDDELLGKARGFTVAHSEGLLQVTYEYDLQGRIFKKHWSTTEYYVRSGTETYYYNESGLISKINKHMGRDINYLWTHGRITRSEETQDDVLKSYVEYEYDDHGNISGAFPYYRQSDGQFAPGMFTIYLYFNDGNVYKSLTYNPVADGEPVLVSTRTYEDYSEMDNPFPMVEIIPTVVSQKKLPGFYEIEESGNTKSYHISYTFGNDGVLLERTASCNTDTQVATYQYY